MKVKCRTLFDCSATGVTGHFRASQVPYQDKIGQTINNVDDWNRSRNQQRNWETLLQIISLRSQPEDIRFPRKQEDHWEFEFTVATEGVFGQPNSKEPFADLYKDCEGIPMITNLHEEVALTPVVCAHGAEQNIWFESVNN